MPKAITYIDLFSGIGGFREGLSRAGGFVCVGHCEIDKYADRSYPAHSSRDECAFFAFAEGGHG